jgi:hypothetical protein
MNNISIGFVLLATLAMAASPGCGGPASGIHDCNDGVDNDRDGRIDGQDPGCAGNNDAEAPDPVIPACRDGVDNDGDGFIDFPADPGCVGTEDDDEYDARPAACSDGFDNDGDALIDHPDDPGCLSGFFDDESDDCPDGPACPRCGNQQDDDGHGMIDYPDDPGCDHAADGTEFDAHASDCGTLAPVSNLALSSEATGRAEANTYNDLSSPTCGGGGQESVYVIDVPRRSLLVITTDFPDTTLDTVVYVRSACRDVATELGCNDDAGGKLAATLEVTVEPGMYYVIVDAHHGASSGDFRVRVTSYVPQGELCDPPALACASGYVCRLADVNATEATCELPSCRDGRDNELDGLADFPADPGCETAGDDDEADDCPAGPTCPACGNGVDDDGDMLIDHAGADPGCASAADPNERDACVPGRDVQTLPQAGVTGTLPAGSSLVQGSCTGAATPEHVYAYDLDRDLVSLSFSTAGSGFDTGLYARLSDCGQFSAELACDNDFPAGETITLPAPAQGTYFVMVDGNPGTGTGAYALNVSGVIPAGESCDPADARFVCDTGFVCAVNTCVPTDCNNGVDDDGDGRMDFPDDPGCVTVADIDESDDCPAGPGCPACGNGMDDDGDGVIDHPLDPGCQSAADTNELDQCVPGVEVLALIPGGVSGTTAGSGRLQGSCGGSTSPEAVYAFELGRDLVSLRFTTRGSSLDTVTHVRRGDCASATAEVGCRNLFGGGEEVVLPSPARGTYFVIVDGNFTAGAYTLDVTGIIPAGGVCDPAEGNFVCSSGHVCAAGVCTAAACNNGVDDDADGRGDYPLDPGCASPGDEDESDDCVMGPLCPACGNGVDDDGDGVIDHPADIGCSAAGDDEEDDCTGESDPVEVIAMGTLTGATLGLTDDFTPACAAISTAPDKAFILPVSTPLVSLRVHTEGSGFDTTLSIKPASCSQPDLACDDNSGAGSRSLIELSDVDPGAYLIIVDGFGSSSGSYLLDVHGVIRGGGRCDPALVSSGLYSCETGHVCTVDTCVPAP